MGRTALSFVPGLSETLFDRRDRHQLPLSAYQPQLTYDASIGTDLLLFGPIRRFSVGVRLDNEHNVRWKAELHF